MNTISVATFIPWESLNLLMTILGIMLLAGIFAIIALQPRKDKHEIPIHDRAEPTSNSHHPGDGPVIRL